MDADQARSSGEHSAGGGDCPGDGCQAGRLLQRIVDAIPAPVFFKDAECRYIGCNEAFARGILGRAPEEVAGKGVYDLAPPHLAAVYEEADRALLASGGVQVYETRVRFTDGSERDISFHKAVFPDDAGAPGGIVGVMLDITERRRHERQLEEREAMFRSVFEASEDAILILDDDTFADCNPATLHILRQPDRDHILGRRPCDISPEFQPDGQRSCDKAAEMVRIAYERHFHRFEWTHLRADGEPFPCEVTLTTMAFRGRSALYVVWNDITERRQRERRIEELAHYDPLTGLPNRRLLHARGSALLARADDRGEPVGVMYMDLNRFKDINDTQGHEHGDALLQQVAGRLREVLPERCLLARLGGDEFAVLIPGADEAILETEARRVLECFERPFRHGSFSAELGASIGLVHYPEHGASLPELLKNADIAMYEAKLGGLGYCVFRRAQANHVQERVALERALREAIAAQDIELHYQPRVDVRDGRITGLEALARWYRPDRGWVSPAEFVPLAEQTGLVHALDRLVLNTACVQARDWRSRGLNPRVGVNISALTLQQDDFVATVLAALAACGLPGDALEVEVTESAAMHDAEANTVKLTELKGHGVRVAIDDFGTGYSSLSYLKRLPVDCLKVDQSFVRDIPGDPMDLGLVETIIALAASMGLTTVAEGVETPEQLDAVRRLGCGDLQGFLAAAPASADDLEAVLRRGYIELHRSR
ncbi:hypothetical protein KBTX_03864 [wastewater metagenome]|uniref:Signaling protein n=2 Tax=unclassified sequences TaxID=12908 RepID=A0A5B8RHV2_9ZZZZ|nr:EAL domain-containing protein [Arhodomonas sp. KWT]QEA07508.1 hypothetical protein KBTEX_03864 [uncultured organism]